MIPSSSPLINGRILINHLGFPCDAEKTFIVRDPEGGSFEVQDMGLIRPTGRMDREDFQPVYTGQLEVRETSLGTFAVGDFSALTTPGIYRIVLPETGDRSFHFAITDGVFSRLPEVFLNFIHAWRSGDVENSWRGPSHMDDAVRGDDGRVFDGIGGWYDAGDTRKWMVHSNLPALALMDAHELIPWESKEWEHFSEGWSPWLLEARWGLDFMLKMQDRETGMFYEDIGGGGGARKGPGMSWWYENHSGCYADNSDNRFTDNVSGSGDERILRVQYNPIVQFTSVAILARAARLYAKIDPQRSAAYEDAARRGWELGLNPDPKYYESEGENFGTWTSVRSWRSIAALELYRHGVLSWEEVETCTEKLLENFSPTLGFWIDRTNEAEPYRGILHSAQPLIALAEVIKSAQDEVLIAKLKGVLHVCLENYILPLSGQSPFGFMPFGVYTKAASEGDVYRAWKNDLVFRFFMPARHHQNINHGLGGHWMSWAHGLALVGSVLQDARATNLAWKQIHWVTGQNLHNATLISGVGYNNPMPYSRFFGTYIGGFCAGFCSTPEDMPYQDQIAEPQWNSTEYWMVPLSNMLMALTLLIPKNSQATHKLGCRITTP